MDGNGDTEAENVIRLPRDWVGPPEELVPLGSRAREGRPADGPPDGGDRRDATPDAGDFWGETASSVHRVMRAPIETRTVGRARRRRARPRPPRVRRRTAAMTSIAAIVGVTVVVAILGMSEGRHPPADGERDGRGAGAPPGGGYTVSRHHASGPPRLKPGGAGRNASGSGACVLRTAERAAHHGPTTPRRPPCLAHPAPAIRDCDRRHDAGAGGGGATARGRIDVHRDRGPDDSDDGTCRDRHPCRER